MNSYNEAVFNVSTLLLLACILGCLVSFVISIISSISKIRVYNSFSRFLNRTTDLSPETRNFIRLFCDKKTQEDARLEVMREILKEEDCN